MSWDFPYDIDGSGRTAVTAYDEHVRDLIEQVLFTAPGERVMRPDFGSGLQALVFEPGGPEAAATAQFVVQGTLDHCLAGVAAIESVTFTSGDATLAVTVTYQVLRTGERGTTTVRYGGTG